MITDDIELNNDDLSVLFAPAQGCDLLSLIDRRSGIDVMFRSPWRGDLRSARSVFATDSTTAWLDAYPGGMQLLLPNGGSACTMDGVEWPFHGEASQIPWEVISVSEGHQFEAQTWLSRVPLHVHRRVAVKGPSVSVSDTVTNTGSEALDVIWGYHPAFGGDFISDATTVQVEASTYLSDDGAQGEGLMAGHRSSWPHAKRADGTTTDLGRLAAAGADIARLGYVTEVVNPTAIIMNEDLRLGVRIDWDLELFPHAWYWVENHATTGYPWFGRSHVFALEPCSTIPAAGAQAASEQGGTLVHLDPDTPVSTTLTLTLEREDVDV